MELSQDPHAVADIADDQHGEHDVGGGIGQLAEAVVEIVLAYLNGSHQDQVLEDVLASERGHTVAPHLARQQYEGGEDTGHVREAQGHKVVRSNRPVTRASPISAQQRHGHVWGQQTVGELPYGSRRDLLGWTPGGEELGHPRTSRAGRKAPRGGSLAGPVCRGACSTASGWRQLKLTSLHRKYFWSMWDAFQTVTTTCRPL